MARVCMFTGIKPNVANNVSHSHRVTKRRQLPNLQYRRLFWIEGNSFVHIRVSTRAIRTIDKKGLDTFAREQGIDLREYLST